MYLPEMRMRTDLLPGDSSDLHDLELNFISQLAQEV